MRDRAGTSFKSLMSAINGMPHNGMSRPQARKKHERRLRKKRGKHSNARHQYMGSVLQNIKRNGKDMTFTLKDTMYDTSIHNIVCNNFDELVKESIAVQRKLAGLSTYSKRLGCRFDEIRGQAFYSNIESIFENSQISFDNSKDGTIYIQDKMFYIEFYTNDATITFVLYGDKEDIKTYTNVILKYFDEYSCYIKWYYNERERSESISVPVLLDKLPCKEMYPFLGDKSLEEYYDEYMRSDSSILLLIGPPGTGKTTFIKGLLNHTKESAILSYSPVLLEDDYFFAAFLSDTERFMIIEDSDNFIKSREQGNNMMHRFLNVSDGLVTVKGKKMIFSTNLENVNDIDSALIRGGRCFDILEFSLLNQEQANVLAQSKGIDDFDKKEAYSIADVLVPKQEHRFSKNMQTTHQYTKTKTGFI